MAPTQAPRPITVVIADDNELLVDALRAAITANEDLALVATATDGAAAVEAVRAHEPDVVLLDLRLGGEWGLDLAPKLLDAASTAVVVFSAADLGGLADEAARAGVCGLVPKGAPLDEVLQAIVDAGDGR